MVPPGEYSVQAVGKQPLSTCAPQTVTVEPGVVITLNLACDTGIRSAINNVNPENMTISSPAFANNVAIPAEYTCTGQNINPPLSLAGVLEAAKSLALIMDDTDAPRGTWVHWVMWNINPSASEIGENSAPQGAIQGTNSFSNQNYGGPCPPSGSHRYFLSFMP